MSKPVEPLATARQLFALNTAGRLQVVDQAAPILKNDAWPLVGQLLQQKAADDLNNGVLHPHGNLRSEQERQMHKQALKPASGLGNGAST